MAGERESQYIEVPPEEEYVEEYDPSWLDRLQILYTRLTALIDKMVARARNLKKTNMDMGRRMLEEYRPFDAMLRFWVAAWLAPKDPQPWYYLGLAQLDREKAQQAELAFRKALAINPHFNDAIYMLDMMGVLPEAQRALPRATPVAILKRQFDSVADIYDDTQLGELDYNGHMVVYDAFMEHVRPAVGDNGSDMRMLDLGCGTGLCGEMLRSGVGVLTGVDLSAEMLAIARARKGDDGRAIYDHLVQAEARIYLQRHAPQAFDMVVMANLLSYFGDLAPFFRGAHNILADGGYLIFTADEEPQGGYSFDKERALFSHSEEYLREQTERAGFALIDLSMAEVYDREPGWCMVCCKQ